MPLHTIEPRRLYRQIADQLRTLIGSGEWPLGARLPAERELAQRLGVSRPSVREALIALEVQGLVEVRMGSGIYVTAREPAAGAPVLDEAFGPFEIIRARQLIEGELAALAAQRLDADACQGLQRALSMMESEVAQGRAPIDGDRLFHLRLAQAADNGPLLRTVGELFDERNKPLFGRLGQRFENLPGWQCALAEHRAVLQAVIAGDAAAARRLMQQHLQLSHDRLAGPAATAGLSPATPYQPTATTP